MDILIKGMEMPKSCDKCFACLECSSESYDYCNILKAMTTRGERRNDCPLVALPEHGDLIGRQAVLSYFETAFLMGADMDYEDIVGIVSNPKAIPTIVEATE